VAQLATATTSRLFVAQAGGDDHSNEQTGSICGVMIVKGK
jgi:hypothetical protein